MTRTKVRALALCNWKGVFYERYLFDRHVTALEGANGAGKTTVMIAAYVVLLPDMSRLRFTNLGESGAIGGDRGIWGRLGEPGRPSYSVLDLDVGNGERLLAGVRLRRKGEPSVELAPFVITGLSADTQLQELLLVEKAEHEEVPEMEDIRRSVAAAGGELTVCRTLRDYFAMLFERGVTPLRMVSDEDKHKLNEMLRTSMTGGISRALTSELRSFLLKQETGLADTLSRMRSNLDSCRRTRIEVSEARQLERQISSVYEAGMSFFVAGALSIKRRADEARKRLTQARARLDAAERTLADLQRRVADQARRQDDAAARLAELRTVLDETREARQRQARARALAVELADLEGELHASQQQTQEAQTARAACEEDRQARRNTLDQARDAYDRAARGLAKLQDGLDELHRRAHAHRSAKRLLERVRVLTDNAELKPEQARTMLAQLASRSQALDTKLAAVDREASVADTRRQEHTEALAALQAIEQNLTPADPRAPAHQRARQALAALARLEDLADGALSIRRELAEAERLAVRQKRACERAAELDLPFEDGSAALLAMRLAAAEMTRDHNDREAQQADAAAARAAQEQRELRLKLGELEDHSARFAACSAAATRIGSALAETISYSDTDGVDGKLAARHAEVLSRRERLSRERELCLRQAAELEATGGPVPPALLRLRDELGGELVASRFEDLPIDEAAQVEAKLGPLAHAIVVDDVEAAAELIADSDLDGSSVWLVESGTPLESTQGVEKKFGDRVWVHEGGTLRVSPLPSAPSLGRRAREEGARTLRSEAETISTELDHILEELHSVAELRRDAALLAEHRNLLESGDPRAQRQETSAAIETAQATESEQLANAREAKDKADAARAEVDALRQLLPEAMLIEPPLVSERVETLSVEAKRAVSARETLARSSHHRKTLSDLHDVLRVSEDEVDHTEAADSRQEIAAARDQVYVTREAISELLASQHALDWGDAEQALEARESLVPALEAQSQSARETVRSVEAELRAAEARWEAATQGAQTAEANSAALLAASQRLVAEIKALAVDIDSEVDVEAITIAVDEASGAIVRIAEEGARDRERLSQASQVVEAAETDLQIAERQASPASEAWHGLRERCESQGLLHPVVTSREERDSSAIELQAAADSRKQVLIDRLHHTLGSEELINTIADTSSVLDLWLSVRSWLRRRVPAQIADVADPLLALERLRDHLEMLEERLARQEGDLRGASADIARGIDVQLRRAAWQVQRINQHLIGITFGSIDAIRVELHRIDRMEQILRALSSADVQELLFQSSLPVEEALDEVFHRHGGGKTGGQKLLDYREYLEIVVEVQRRGKEEWELASPTRLSTGEAIGVGAALMMVVLTEWERDANLLRARPSGGSLRFLFLDEANRLSRDNLGVLFDLCRALELQLLIAAPEVAQAEGNTTYRLVRRVGNDGNDEVIVSGRRALAAATN